MAMLNQYRSIRVGHPRTDHEVARQRERDRREQQQRQGRQDPPRQHPSPLSGRDHAHVPIVKSSAPAVMGPVSVNQENRPARSGPPTLCDVTGRDVIDVIETVDSPGRNHDCHPT